MEDLFIPLYLVHSEGGAYYQLPMYPKDNYKAACIDADWYDEEIGHLVGIFKLVEVDKDGKEIIKR
jgi:hypothetical protein